MGMKVVTVHLPEPYIEALDELVKRKRYPNRAEAIRMAVRDFLMEEFRIIQDEEEEEKELKRIRKATRRRRKASFS